jgi:hypothetical protein
MSDGIERSENPGEVWRGSPSTLSRKGRIGETMGFPL